MQNKVEEKEFFDQWAKSREYDVFTSSGYNTIIREFLNLIGNRLSNGCRAIDLGCGTGAFTKRIFQNAEAELYGLDISTKAIQLAASRKEKIKYLVGDVENLKFEDNFFDVVIYSGVLHHFSDERKCLAEGYRVLKRGGCIVSYDPSKKNPFMWLYRDQRSLFFSKKGKTNNERLLSDNEMKIVLKDVGFTNVNTHCISGVSFKFVESRSGRFLLPIYNLTDRLLGILPLANKYGSFLICYGEKK